MPSAPVLCNVLWPTRKEALAAARSEIRLGFCKSCGLVFNLIYQPELVEYLPTYENSLHFSPRFQEYIDALATYLIERYNLRGKEIIDIGCGRGDFLALMCERGGNRGLGFDSSFDPAIASFSEDLELRIVNHHFSKAHTNRIAADCFVFRHVLEHVAQPNEFLHLLFQVASRREGSVVYCEVPNAIFTLEDLGVWDVIYEHCSYFSKVSLRKLFTQVGFSPIELQTAFHNQFLCLEVRMSDQQDSKAFNREDREAIDHLLALTGRFADQFTEQTAKWKDAISGFHEKGQKVLVWGAGSKGVTFLNVCATSNAEPIFAVVDINPRKHGRYIPGVGIPVIAPESLNAGNVDVVLVMNPAYRDEIGSMVEQRGITAEICTV